MKDETVEACPPSPSYRLRKFVSKHRTAFATTWAVASLLIVAAGMSIVLAFQAVRAQRQALLEEHVARYAEREAPRQAAGS